jgi:iron(III) transport system ATP-binding protein
VALARSVVVRPRVLLFDEPLSNLDARLRDQMRFELRRIQRQLGVTSVYVTHDQSEAMAMSDRIVVMNDGRVEQIGLPHEIYSRPSTLFVADFIGKANVVPARVLSHDGGRIRVEVLGARLWLEGTAVGSDTDTVVMLRPEHVEVAKSLDDLPDGPGESVSVPGRIQAVEYLGGSSQLTIELVDGTLLTAVQRHGPGELAATVVGDGSREVVVRVTAAALRVVSHRPSEDGAVS